MAPLVRDRVTFSLRPPVAAPGDLERVARIPRVPALVGISGVMLGVFSIPYFTIGGMAPDGSVDDLFELVAMLFQAFWFLGWSCGVGVLALVFLGSLFGQERVRGGAGELILRYELFGAGLSLRFGAAEIDDARCVEPEDAGAGLPRGRHLLLECAGADLRIGVGLSAEEAQALLARLAHERRRGVGRPQPGPAVGGRAPAPRGQLHGPEVAGAGSARSQGFALLALIAANLVPVAGVLLLDWRVGDVMLLFWAESAVIGLWNLARLAVIGRWAAIPLGLFFVGHFGGFMAGHLLFVYSIFVQDALGAASLAGVATSFLHLLPGILALVVSHGISFFQNFVGRREYATTTLREQMTAPYGRIVVMHLTIILGGILVLAFGDAEAPLVLLVGLKIAVDLRAHRREHRPAEAVV